jgi:hypothetical protein
MRQKMKQKDESKLAVLLQDLINAQYAITSFVWVKGDYWDQLIEQLNNREKVKDKIMEFVRNLVDDKQSIS